MLNFKRMMSLVLTLVLLIGMVPPAAARASEAEAEETLEALQETAVASETVAAAETEIPETEVQETEILETEAVAEETQETAEAEYAEETTAAEEAEIPEVSLESAEAVETSGKLGSNLKWTLDDQGVLTITGNGAMETGDIPWMESISQITEVVIQSGVTTIADWAFSYCTNMTAISIADSVTSIGSGAFDQCASLTSVTIPKKVANIGEFAFQGCTGLDGIWVDDANSAYASDEQGVLYNKSMTTLVKAPCTLAGDYVIAQTVTAIGDAAFFDCRNLTGVTIPETVTAIGEWVFEGCTNLKKLTVPARFVNSQFDFVRHPSLTDLTITGTGVIGAETFANCSNLKTVTIQEGITAIGDRAFTYCTNLETVVIPSTVTSIGTAAFAGCGKLKGIDIPSGATTIGAAVFVGCESLTHAEIPEGVAAIGDQLFYGCKDLESVTIPGSVTSIGESAFEGCESLEDVTIPEDVTSIGDAAFAGCEGLTEIVIPEDVTSIGEGVFNGCSGLSDLTIPVRFADQEYDFLSNPSLTDLTITGEGAISDEAFSHCDNLENVVIEEGVTGIGDRAFEYCTNLENIEVPGTVDEIGEAAFAECKNLTEIEIPEGVTEIGASTFNGCESLTDVTIPEGVTDIGDRAFYGCESLKEVIIPGTVDTIGDAAFEDCSAMTSLTIGKGVSEIGDTAFAGCEKLTSITFPASIESIGDGAFAGCTDLTDMLFMGSAPEIGENAFAEIDANVMYMANDPSWTEEVRQNIGENLTWEIYPCSLGHIEAIDAAVPATCTADGKTEGKHCTVCDEVLVAQEVIPALGHELNEAEVIADPTCTEDGVRAGICSRCEEYVEEAIAALGHKEMILPGKAPTCTETGLTDGKYCDVCGETLVEQEEIPANGHNYDENGICKDCTMADKADYDLLSGKSMTLKHMDPATNKPMTAKQITWSMDEKYAPYAKIDAKGKLTAKKVVEKVRVEVVGTILIGEGGTFTETVDIYPAVTAVELSLEGKLLNNTTEPVDQVAIPMAITAKVYPLDAMGDVTWTISDQKKEAYATYEIKDNVLILTPKEDVKPGTVTIKATTADGSKKSATFKIQFGAFASSVTIADKEKLTTMTAGDEAVMLTAAVDPVAVNKPGVVWSLKNAADKNYVTLSSSGKFQPKATVLAPVEVTVVATSKDGMAKDEHTIRILPKATAQLALMADDMYVTKTTQILDVNTQESITLTACTYDNSELPEITWSPLENKAAEITVNEDDSLTVKMIEEGSITVTAKTEDKRSATVTIKGVKQAQALEISQKKTDKTEGLEVASGKALELQAVLEGATDKKVIWSIDKGAQFATVSASGKVTANKDLTIGGEVEVRATAADGSGATNTIKIMVRPLAQGVQVYSQEGGRMLFSFRSNSGLAVRSNTTLTWDLSTQDPAIDISARVFPYYGTVDEMNAIQGVEWKSSATKVADIVNGQLEIRGTGTTTITVTATDGSKQKVSFKLNVVENITEFRMEPQSLISGKSLSLAKLLTINPKETTTKKVTWAITSGSEYATISGSGALKANKNLISHQVVQVTVTAQDTGAHSEIFAVDLYPAIKVKILDEKAKNVAGKTLTLAQGSEYQLAADCEPNDDAAKYVWTSAMPEAVSVDETGKVTVHGEKGTTVVITCTVNDGSNQNATVKIKIG